MSLILVQRHHVFSFGEADWPQIAGFHSRLRNPQSGVPLLAYDFSPARDVSQGMQGSL